MGRPRGQHIPQRIVGDPADPRGFPALVDQYCNHLDLRDYSLETIRVSRGYLAMLAAWLETRDTTRPEDVDRDTLTEYQRHLRAHRKEDGSALSAYTLGAAVGPVRRFYAWATENGLVPADPTTTLVIPRRGQRLPKAVMTAEEAELTLNRYGFPAASL